MGNFGDCTPVMPTKTSGIFHLDYDHFNDDVAEKAALYTRDSTEDLFLDALSGIVQKTYLATDEIICYVDILNDIEQFPNDKKFAEITSHRNSLTKKLTNLMNKLTPINEINKQLWTMLKHDMDGHTKIDKKVFEQLKKVGLEISSYTKIFEKNFNDFPMSTLMEHLYAITGATLATNELNKRATALNSLIPAMSKTVDFGLKMDYTTLYKAQQKFRDIVMKALNVQTFFGDFSSKK